jgi:hypothetical protein
MVSWWWIPACLFGGTCLGVIIMGAVQLGKWATRDWPIVPPEKWIDKEKEEKG